MMEMMAEDETLGGEILSAAYTSDRTDYITIRAVSL
jgi:hypothetical protein